MNSKSFFEILGFVIFLLQISSSIALRYCPNYCKCDLYEGRNRADCSGKRLINPYVDLSAAVEVLDLSYNDIAIIDDDCFENYHYLINLTITHNDVHTIYLDAFVKLRRLSAVDLSYNRLEYIDERLFEANHHLQLLNLEGNKFMTLPSGPILRSTSLRILNLRNAGINFIENEVFTALPQLTDLDLSQNILITLSAAAFNAAKHLKRLQLDENKWTCDKAMVGTLSILRHRGVNVSIPECDGAYREWRKQLPLRAEIKGNSGGNSSSGSGGVGGSGRNQLEPHMFEQMRILEDFVNNGTNNSNSTNNSNTSILDVNYDDNKTFDGTKTFNWRNLTTANGNIVLDGDGDEDKASANGAVHDDVDDDDDDDDIVDFASYIGDSQHISRTRLSLLGVKVDEKLCDGTRENLCRRYRNCLEQVSHVLIKQMDKLDTKATNYTESEMYLAFIFGNVVGIAVVVFLLTCVLFLKNLCSKCKKSKEPNDLESVYETLPYVAHLTQVPVQPLQPAAAVTAATPQTAPFPTRRTRRRRRQPVRVPIEHAIVRHDYEPGTDSFISRLLGRPARRQYYRATATLIRSLSRTSLFNGNGQRDQNNSPRTPQIDETTAPLNQLRPETPPPKYGDIIEK